MQINDIFKHKTTGDLYTLTQISKSGTGINYKLEHKHSFLDKWDTKKSLLANYINVSNLVDVIKPMVPDKDKQILSIIILDNIIHILYLIWLTVLTIAVMTLHLQ